MSEEKERTPAEGEPPAEAAAEAAPGADGAAAPDEEGTDGGAAPEPEASEPEDPVERLEGLLAEERDRALRALAEAENTRKRAERERADLVKYGASALARDILGVVDILERALAEEPGKGEASAEALRKGVDITLQEFLATLRRHGVERVDPAQGDPFDHDRHQAVSHAERDDVAPGAVAEILQAGYVLRGRLLRPATVAVAKAPAEAEAEAEDGPEAEGPADGGDAEG